MKKFIKEIDGLEVYFEALPEYDPNYSYWEEDLKNETIEKLDNLELTLFCAKVSIEFQGKTFSDQYLGMCIYESEEQFYTTEGDYFDDMVNEGIKEAKEEIKEIVKTFS